MSLALVFGASRVSPLTIGQFFLSDKLGISDITLDRSWVGPDGTLSLQFLSLSDRLRALRLKKKLFPLPSKIFLNEDLTRAWDVALRHFRGLVAEAKCARKWEMI